jgi:hypothetical protein
MTCMLAAEQEDALVRRLSTLDNVKTELEATEKASTEAAQNCKRIRGSMSPTPCLKSRITFHNSLNELRAAKEAFRDAQFAIDELRNAQKELDELRKAQLAELDAEHHELLG